MFSVKIYQIFLFYIVIIVYLFKKFKDLFRSKITVNKFKTDENILKSEKKMISIDKKTKLERYCQPLPMSFLQKFHSDITQGSGYDYILEENAKLSKLFWLGNHKRSITHEESIKILDTFLKKNNKKSITILDIGCGSGTTIIRLWNFLREKGINFKIYACDIYSNVLIECIHNLSKESINCELLICNGEDLPYKDNSFDIVVNFGSINQFKHIDRGLKEMLRVCNPTGICICRDEHYDSELLNDFEKQYFSFLKDETIPYKLLPENISYNIVHLNKIHFLLTFFKHNCNSDENTQNITINIDSS